jgi:hypothetical protein
VRGDGAAPGAGGVADLAAGVRGEALGTAAAGKAKVATGFVHGHGGSSVPTSNTRQPPMLLG